MDRTNTLVVDMGTWLVKCDHGGNNLARLTIDALSTGWVVSIAITKSLSISGMFIPKSFFTLAYQTLFAVG